MPGDATLVFRIVLCAVVYGIVWKFGDREAREATAIGAIPSWVLALVMACALAGGLVYAQSPTTDATFDPNCELVWWFGLPWCWWW